MVDTIEIYSNSEKIRSRNHKKVYCIDWALAYVVSYGAGIDETRAFENMIYIELKRRRYDINYFKTRDGFEIDFVTTNREDRSINIYQVAYSIENDIVRNREFRALIKSAKYLGAKNTTVITFDEEGLEILDEIEINIIPVWKWLLQKIE